MSSVIYCVHGIPKHIRLFHVPTLTARRTSFHVREEKATMVIWLKHCLADKNVTG